MNHALAPPVKHDYHPCMENHLSVGKAGENAAADYLTQKKYRIVERNHLRRWGEIDIVAMTRDKTLVFVEVKTLSIGAGDKAWAGLRPEDNMTPSKIMKTRRAAQAYANAHPKLVTDTGWRIDMVAVDICDGVPLDIRHYENI